MMKKPISNPITALLFQAWVWPPYCSARVYEMINPIIRIAPTKSICSSFSFHVAGTAFAFAGVSKKNRTTTAAIPPMGRLM